METTTLGKTGLEVSRLGIGLFEISGLEGPEAAEEASRLLNTGLDGGINFLDTAACYGNSEDLIGSAVAHRRDEYVLATKCGHVAGGGVRCVGYREHGHPSSLVGRRRAGTGQGDGLRASHSDNQVAVRQLHSQGRALQEAGQP